MNTNVINKLPLQTKRMFRVLFCPMEIPYSLVSGDHCNGRASLGDEHQMPMLAHNLPLLAHMSILKT
jgi:hypothetical protein